MHEIKDYKSYFECLARKNYPGVLKTVKYPRKINGFFLKNKKIYISVI